MTVGFRTWAVLVIIGAAIASKPNHDRKNTGDDEECVKISDYAKPKHGKPCTKDLSPCYQYRCGAVARHCSECEAHKGPCIDFESPENSVRRSKRSTDDTSSNATTPSVISTLLESIRSRIQTLMSQVQGSAQIPKATAAVPVERIGNAMVHISAGLKKCAGFLTTVNGRQGRTTVILTSAQCLIKFETTCRSPLEKFGSKFVSDPNTETTVDGYATYMYNHSWPCFGDYDSEIKRVSKSFRAYSAIVTSYKGESIRIPLSSRHVIVPRDYMQCQDCRHDYAAIALDNQDARAILNGQQPFVLTPNKKPIEWTRGEVTQLVAVTNEFGPNRLRKATESKFCTVSYTTPDKMCFKLTIPPNVENPPQLLPGSPLFIPFENLNGQTEYHCVGIFTGAYNVVEENLSTDNLLADEISGPIPGESISVRVRYSKNGAVRVTHNLVALLEKLSGDVTLRNTSADGSPPRPQQFPIRRECFPSVSDPYDAAEQLCLCALGWKDEKDHCKKPDAVHAQGCLWKDKAFRCDASTNVSREDFEANDSKFESNVIPGTTRQLSLRGRQMSDIRQLENVLYHLTDLEELYLDDNNIMIISDTLFSRNPELKVLSMQNNGIETIGEDAFRHNPKLRHLNLANNRIRFVHADAIVRALDLRSISFENNNLGYISPNLFRKNAHLEQIFLGYNNVSFLGGKILHHQPKLKEFHVNHNLLQRITNGLLNRNRLLTTVDFSHNKIAIITRNTFDNNPELRYVTINHNQIPAIPYRIFWNQMHLLSFNASVNPLKRPDETARYFRTIGVPFT